MPRTNDVVALDDWYVIAHASEIKSGASERTVLLGEDLTVSRDRAGVVRCVAHSAEDLGIAVPVVERYSFLWVTLGNPTRDIVAVPGGAEFARAVVAEAAAVAVAAGHPVSGDELRRTEQTLTAAGSTATASMSRDLLAGRPVEVDVLADFAERGRAVGAPARLIEVSVLGLRVHNRRALAANGERGR